MVYPLAVHPRPVDEPSPYHCRSSLSPVAMMDGIGGQDEVVRSADYPDRCDLI